MLTQARMMWLKESAVPARVSANELIDIASLRQA
jgi:hypothetical protein